MIIGRVVWALGAFIAFAVMHRVAAAPSCKNAPASPGVITDTSSSATLFNATGKATIMSETVEGLAVAEDAARLDAKAALVV